MSPVFYVRMVRTLTAGKVSEILHFPEDLCTGRASYSPMTINDIVSGIKATGGITVTGVFDDLDHIEEYCNYVPEVIDYRSIGERVRELRKEKKLIQKDFGEKVGSSPSAIFKIETHLNHATDKTLHDIADTFDVGFEWLKFGDERYRKSPVNRKLIEWLMVHQEIRDQLWKKMMDEEQN